MKWGAPAPTYLQRVYTKGPLMFVPLYTDARLYVGPGYPHLNLARYTPDELLKAGCKPQDHYLLASIGMTEID